MKVNDKMRDLRDLIKRDLLSPWRRLTIGINGIDGVGKSALSRYLAWELDMPAINSDMFMNYCNPQPSFRYDDLQRAVASRHDRDLPVIIEGVFLLDTLREIDVECDFLIYVSDTTQEPIDKHKPCNPLEASLSEYTKKYDPEAKAQFKFTRDAWDPH